jgi:hypothetical protein
MPGQQQTPARSRTRRSLLDRLPSKIKKITAVLTAVLTAVGLLLTAAKPVRSTLSGVIPPFLKVFHKNVQPHCFPACLTASLKGPNDLVVDESDTLPSLVVTAENHCNETKAVYALLTGEANPSVRFYAPYCPSEEGILHAECWGTVSFVPGPGKQAQTVAGHPLFHPAAGPLPNRLFISWHIISAESTTHIFDAQIQVSLIQKPHAPKSAAAEKKLSILMDSGNRREPYRVGILPSSVFSGSGVLPMK